MEISPAQHTELNITLSTRKEGSRGTLKQLYFKEEINFKFYCVLLAVSYPEGIHQLLIAVRLSESSF